MTANSSLLDEHFLQSTPVLRACEQIQDFCSFLKKLPLSDFSIDVSINQAYEVTTRLRAVENVEYQSDLSLSLNLYRNKSRVTIQCYGFNPLIWQQSAEQGYQYLDYVDEDPNEGLAVDYDYTQTAPLVESFFPQSLSRNELHQRIIEMESIALDDSSITNSEGAFGQVSYSLLGQLNSRGLEHYVGQSYYSHGIQVVASTPRGVSQVDGSYSGALCWSKLDDPNFSAKLAQKRVKAKLHPRSIPSGVYPVVFTPHASDHLIKALMNGLSGRAQYKKTSFVQDALSQTLLPNWCSLTHQPLLEGAHYSYPLDANGLIAKHRSIIEEGKVLEYILSLYSARRLGLKPNHLAGGVKNLAMTTNALNFDEVVSKFPRCIVVDDVMGTGVNLVNGDYSMGICGFYYEKGECLFSLKDSTIAGHLKEMLQKIVFHASDNLIYKNFQIGTLAIEQMTVSSGP